MPSPTALDEMLKRSLGWLSRNLDGFYPIDDEGKFSISRSKALGELSIMCAYYRRRFGSHSDDPVNKLVSFSYKALQDSLYRQVPARNPELILLHAGHYVALTQCGLEDLPFREMLQDIIAQDYTMDIDRAAFRMMDLSLTLRNGGFKYKLPPLETLYRRTTLAKSSPILYMTLGDVYSITHTIFYLTDWGFDRSRLKEVDSSRVNWVVQSLLALYLRRHNWDVALELLMCCRILNVFPDPLYEQSWSYIFQAQREEGSVPSPASEEKSDEVLDQSEETKAFNLDYHTTLVAAIACMMNL